MIILKIIGIVLGLLEIVGLGLFVYSVKTAPLYPDDYGF